MRVQLNFRLMAWLLFACSLNGAETATNAYKILPRFVRPQPFEPLRATAQKKQIPLESIDPLSEGDRVVPGTWVTALMTLHQKGAKEEQWLVYLEPTPAKQKKETVGDVAKKRPPMVLYSSLSNKFEFPSSPLAGKVQTLGPFKDPRAKGRAPRSAEKEATCWLDESFLRLGLDAAATAVMRFRSTGIKGGFWFGPRPPTAKEAKMGREIGAKLQLSSAEERALVASLPALISYVGIVQNTPGLQDILMNVVQIPSLWSLVSNMGVKTVNVQVDSDGIAATDPAPWGLPPDARAFLYPLDLEMNGQHALHVTLVVTRPKPPYLACAGVVGLLAENPTSKETYLTLHVVSAGQKSP